MKYFPILLCALLSGCGLFDDCDYNNDSGNYGSKIFLGEMYTASTEYSFWENDSARLNSTARYELQSKPYLFLRKDSTFSFFSIWENDTISWATGKFSIRKSPKSWKPWHSFILVADSLKRRLHSTQDGKIVLSDSIMTYSTFWNEDSVLLNVDKSDSCFTLASLSVPPDDITQFCAEAEVRKTRTFCIHHDSLNASAFLKRIKW